MGHFDGAIDNAPRAMTEPKEALIHRFGLSGGAQCGAGPDSFGRLRISNSGVGVTCPECNPKYPHPSRVTVGPAPYFTTGLDANEEEN